jgi:hypothetical protein
MTVAEKNGSGKKKMTVAEKKWYWQKNDSGRKKMVVAKKNDSGKKKMVVAKKKNGSDTKKKRKKKNGSGNGGGCEQLLCQISTNNQKVAVAECGSVASVSVWQARWQSVARVGRFAACVCPTAICHRHAATATATATLPL